MHTTILKGLVIAAGLTSAPLAFGVGGQLFAGNNAYCAEGEGGGTCCPQEEAVCYPEGCHGHLCNLDDHYWRTDGKPCGAPTG